MALVKRGKTWHTHFFVDGQRFRQSLDTSDWREAQSKEKDLIADAKAGKLSPTKQEFARLPFREAAERFLQDRIPQLAPLSVRTERERAKVLNRLVDDIRAHQNHTTAGDIGFHYVIQALSEGGRSDVIYDLLANPDPPSYASQLARGATSLTEAWDASPRSSQNHFMLGHAEEWFYRYLAGIDLDLSRPTDERIVLRPTPVGDVTSCDATLHSVLGPIVSRWKVANGHLIYDVEIPPNTKAKVLLPSGPQEIGSGSRHFDVPLIR